MNSELFTIFAKYLTKISLVSLRRDILCPTLHKTCDMFHLCDIMRTKLGPRRRLVDLRLEVDTQKIDQVVVDVHISVLDMKGSGGHWRSPADGRDEGCLLGQSLASVDG